MRCIFTQTSILIVEWLTGFASVSNVIFFENLVKQLSFILFRRQLLARDDACHRRHSFLALVTYFWSLLTLLLLNGCCCCCCFHCIQSTFIAAGCLQCWQIKYCYSIKTFLGDWHVSARRVNRSLKTVPATFKWLLRLRAQRRLTLFLLTRFFSRWFCAMTGKETD